MSTIQSTPAPEDHSAPSDPPAPVFAMSLINQTVTMDALLPFEVACESIVPIVQANGQIRAVRSQTSLIYGEPTNTYWFFHGPLLPIIEDELRRRGLQPIVEQSSLNFVTLPATPLGSRGANAEQQLSREDLPNATLEFLSRNQYATLEYQDRRHMFEYVGRLADQFPNARIAIIAGSRDYCWSFCRGLSQQTRSRAYVVARDLTEAALAGLERPPRIVIGMPFTLSGNVGFTRANSFDIFIIADKRLLNREYLFDFFQWARAGARIYTCLPSDAVCDPKWQAKIFEYGGLTRGLLLPGGGVLRQPRIAIENLNWNVSGDDLSTTEAECAIACDNENRRMRAIERLLGRRQYVDRQRNTYLVFATRDAADRYCTLDRTFSRFLDEDTFIGHATRMVLHSDQLDRLRIAGDNLFVWAGARSEPIDLYRALANQIVDTAELAFLDLQDFPQGRGGAGSSLASIARDWNRTRRQTYARWGYLPEGDDFAALRVARHTLIRNRGADQND